MLWESSVQISLFFNVFFTNILAVHGIVSEILPNVHTCRTCMSSGSHKPIGEKDMKKEVHGFFFLTSSQLRPSKSAIAKQTTSSRVNVSHWLPLACPTP